MPSDNEQVIEAIENLGDAITALRLDALSCQIMAVHIIANVAPAIQRAVLQDLKDTRSRYSGGRSLPTGVYELFQPSPHEDVSSETIDPQLVKKLDEIIRFLSGITNA